VLEENRALVCHFVDEMLNRQNLAVIDEAIAADFIDHDAPPDQIPGPEGVRHTFEQVQQSLTSFLVVTDDVIAEGDRVAVRHTAEATHSGSFLGFAPTGKRLRWTAIGIYRIANGRIAEHWGLMDLRALGNQLAA
jgi:predicted ester cyclase